jgi:hypothetical protein
MSELTCDLFSRACLLAKDEAMIICYQIGKYCIGRIVLSHNVQFLKWKHQNAIKKILNTIQPHVVNYYVTENPDLDNDFDISEFNSVLSL